MLPQHPYAGRRVERAQRDIRELVAGVLSDEGYDCRTAADSGSALAAIDALAGSADLGAGDRARLAVVRADCV